MRRRSRPHRGRDVPARGGERSARPPPARRAPRRGGAAIRRGGRVAAAAWLQNRPISTSPPSAAWSTCSVVCSMPNSSRGARSSSRRRPWQSSPRPTSTCAESAGNPEVIVQMWRSCTSTTPGAPRKPATERPRVDAARRRLEQDRRRVAEDRPRAREHEHADEDARDGSASTQPVVRITIAATATPTDPRMSAKTCRNAASTLRLCAARPKSTSPATTFTREPDERDREHPAAERVAGIVGDASTASTKIQIASATSSTPFASAARTSARLKP